MKLLIMRHGIASFDTDDFHRPLTEAGIEGVEHSANKFALHGDVPLKIFASPLVRAQQTAHLMKQVLKLDCPIETLSSIQPESDVGDFINFIENLNEKSLCLFVTHQPFVGLVLNYLTGSEDFMDTADINCVTINTFSKGGGDQTWRIRSH